MADPQYFGFQSGFRCDRASPTLVSKIHDFYYVDGKRIGDVDSDGPTRVDYVQSLALVTHTRFAGNDISTLSAWTR